jgi:exodeoxyribonuclease-1
VDEQGNPVMKLEALTAANGIEHAGAHDALVDVRATIAMARKLKQAQPRLYDFAFQLRE